MQQTEQVDCLITPKFAPHFNSMNTQTMTNYKVKDISLAEWGRKENQSS